MSRPDRPLRARPLRARPLRGRGGAEARADGRTDAPVMLSCRQVAVRFGGLQALDRVDLETRKGEIVGLIGPNGAGKTTLMECISGFQPVAGGGITYLRPDTGAEEDLLRRLSGERAGMGIGRTLQNVRLFPYLTVLDNFRVALHRHMRMGALAFKASKDCPKSSRAASPMLADLEATLLLRVKQETDATILMIEHDMPLIMGLADWIYCLDAGRNLAAGPPDVVQANPAVIEAYLGTPREQQLVAEATQTQRPRRRSTVRSGAPAAGRGAAVDTGSASTPEAETLLELSGIDVYYDRVQVLYDVNVVVGRGERVALLGTNGAGKSTILKTASGLIQPSAGTVRWKGEDATRLRAEELVRRGLGHVPGGRGLFPTLTVGENLRMGGYIYDDVATVDAEVRRAIHYFPWIGERLEQPAGTLSGGEQQQLATARALMARPELLMIDELSLGLAPIVIERLMDTVQRLHDEEGLTVLLVEQQASFALGYTDRAYFLEKGEVRYEGPAAGLSERPDLLRSVFLAGAVAGFAGSGAKR